MFEVPRYQEFPQSSAEAYLELEADYNLIHSPDSFLVLDSRLVDPRQLANSYHDGPESLPRLFPEGAQLCTSSLATFAERVQSIRSLAPGLNRILRDPSVGMPPFFLEADELLARGEATKPFFFSYLHRTPAVSVTDFGAKILSLAAKAGDTTTGAEAISEYLENRAEFLLHEVGHILDYNNLIGVDRKEAVRIAEMRADLIDRFEITGSDLRFLSGIEKDVIAEGYRALVPLADRAPEAFAAPRYRGRFTEDGAEAPPKLHVSGVLSLAQWIPVFRLSGPMEVVDLAREFYFERVAHESPDLLPLAEAASEYLVEMGQSIRFQEVSPGL